MSVGSAPKPVSVGSSTLFRRHRFSLIMLTVLASVAALIIIYCAHSKNESRPALSTIEQSDATPVDEDTLQRRTAADGKDLNFLPNSTTPFTGVSQSEDRRWGGRRCLKYYKDGNVTIMEIYYISNGQMRQKSNFITNEDWEWWLNGQLASYTVGDGKGGKYTKEEFYDEKGVKVEKSMDVDDYGRPGKTSMQLIFDQLMKEQKVSATSGQ